MRQGRMNSYYHIYSMGIVLKQSLLLWISLLVDHSKNTFVKYNNNNNNNNNNDNFLSATQELLYTRALRN